jgi:hypothetical protein
VCCAFIRASNLTKTDGSANTDLVIFADLVWFDRSGKRLATVGEPGRHTRPALSPDEKQVAVDRFDPQSRRDRPTANGASLKSGRGLRQ